MGIEITIRTGETTGREWSALAAFVAVMQKPSVMGAAPDAEKIADKMLDAAFLQAADAARTEGFATPAEVAALFPAATAQIQPADNPATGTDPDLASFGVGNALGGTVTAAPFVAVPAAGAAPSLPPATPPAPPAPASAAALPANNALLDVRGLPWDHRIHSGEKTQNKDGSWRNKRGLADGLVETVEAELRAVMAIPPGPTIGGVPVAPAWPASPPPPTDAGPITFLKLMPKVTGAIKSGQTTQEHVNAVLKQFGFPHLPAVSMRPDLLQAVHDGIFGGGAR